MAEAEASEARAMMRKRRGAGNDNWGFSSRGMTGYGEGGDSSWYHQQIKGTATNMNFVRQDRVGTWPWNKPKTIERAGPIKIIDSRSGSMYHNLSQRKNGLSSLNRESHFHRNTCYKRHGPVKQPSNEIRPTRHRRHSKVLYSRFDDATIGVPFESQIRAVQQLSKTAKCEGTKEMPNPMAKAVRIDWTYESDANTVLPRRRTKSMNATVFWDDHGFGYGPGGRWARVRRNRTLSEGSHDHWK